MTAESAPTLALSSPEAPAHCKVRLRFGKGFDLRLLSHKDLMRAFERLFRRADVAVAYSQGFNPHPKIVFALSLPLGVIGREEVVEVELKRAYPLDELRQRVSRQAPPGLTFHDLCVLPPKASAHIADLIYRLPLPADALPTLRANIPELLARTEVVVRRDKAPGQRVDLRPSIVDLRLVELTGSAWHSALELELRPAPAGTARPEEVYALLGLPDLLERGGVLERSRLRLVDELPTALSEGIPCPRSC